MATKRVAATAVDWAEFARKIPPANKGAFQALKTKQDAFVRTINQLPDTLPAIDFVAYRGRIAPAMVDDFEKKYKGLEIPYPKDTTAAELAGEGAKQKTAYEKYVAESQARCGTVTTELTKWENMMPVEEMNKEEAMAAVPHLVPEHRPGKPEFWPFDKDFAVWQKELEVLKVEWEKEGKLGMGKAGT